MATLHFKDCQLYVGMSTAILITEASEVQLNVEFDTPNDSAFGDTWDTFLKGTNRWTGSFNANFDTASSQLFDLAVGTTISNVYVYPARTSSARYYYGQAWPDLQITGSRTDAGRVSGKLTGSGQLAQN